MGYIINKSDIASVSETDGIVESITLATGKKAYKIQQLGNQPFNGTAIEMQDSEILKSFNKIVAFVVLDNSPSVSQDIIEPLANGEFVVIIENKYNVAASKNAFEIVGLEVGAKATAISQNKYENMAGWSIELTEQETPVANKFVWSTDYTTTKSMLEALTA